MGYIAQGDRHIAYPLDDGTRQLVHIRRRQGTAHDVFVPVFIDDSSIGILIHVACSSHHLGQGNAVVFHACRVQPDLVLLDVAAQHGNLCHTAHGEQAWTDGPVGKRTQVEHRGAVGCQSDNHQLAQDGRLRSECRVAHIVGQLLADDGQLLRHNLASQVDVRSPVKLHPDDREAVGGRRTHATYIGRPVDCGLYGESHELLHFLGCHTVGFGHDHHRGRIEVGEHIHFGVERCIGTAHHQQHGSNQDKDAVVE